MPSSRRKKSRKGSSRASAERTVSARKKRAKAEGAAKRPRAKRRGRVPRPLRRRRPEGATSVGFIVGCQDLSSNVTEQPRRYVAPDCYKVCIAAGCQTFAPFCTCPPAERKLRLFSDVDAALRLQHERPDLYVDIIYPRHVNAARLEKNDFVFASGYDTLSAYLDSGAGDTAMVSEGQARTFIDAVRAQGNKVCPSPALREFGTNKRKYYQRAMDVGVPIAPTAFARTPAERTPEAVIAIARSRGWDDFIVKPAFGGWSLGMGFFHLKGRDAEEETIKSLTKHLQDKVVKESPDIVVQKYMNGFSKHPEVRTFWAPDGEFLYAVSNWIAGKVLGATQRSKIPERYLEGAKRVGRMAVERMLPEKPLSVVRVDVACQSMAHGKLFFYLNEIDPNPGWHSARYPRSVSVFAKVFAKAVDKVRARH